MSTDHPTPQPKAESRTPEQILEVIARRFYREQSGAFRSNYPLDETQFAGYFVMDYKNELSELAALQASNAELVEALNESNRTLVAAHDRIHTLPRTTDTQLVQYIERTRAKIKAALTANQGK